MIQGRMMALMAHLQRLETGTKLQTGISPRARTIWVWGGLRLETDNSLRRLGTSALFWYLLFG